MWALLMFLPGCVQGKKDASATAPSEDTNEPVKEAHKGPVSLRVFVTPKTPRLSDLVQLVLEARAGPNVDLKPPVFGKAVGDFLIRDYRDAPPRIEGDQTVRRFEYQLEPVQTGRHLIRALEVIFTDKQPGSEGEGKSGSVELEPFSIEVTSELEGGVPDLARLAPMAEPVELPPKPWPAWVWWAMGGATAALALLGAVLWRRKLQKDAEPPPRTPEEIALAELQALMGELLPEQGLFADFYVRLTGIVRRYIERTSGLHAPEQTTEEFLRAMRGDARFDPQQAKRLEHFLAACDLVKFAAQRPEAQEIQDAFQRAQEFVGLAGGARLVATPVAVAGVHTVESSKGK